MSFGISIGDFIVLTQLASDVVQGARRACGAHDELTREVTSLHIVLRQLEREVGKPHSILNSNDDDRKIELITLADHCQKSLKVLSNILDKYNGLSEEKRLVTKLWKRVQFANGEMQDLSKLRLELSTHTNVITLFLNLLSVGSLGKVEEQMVSQGEELRAVRRSVNWVTASLQASAGHGEGSILTSYTDDDKGFWKDFRRKMVKEGHTSRVIRKHETLIMNYVKELGDRGALDELSTLEEVPVEDSKQEVEDDSKKQARSPSKDQYIVDPPSPLPLRKKLNLQTHNSAPPIVPESAPREQPGPSRDPCTDKLPSPPSPKRKPTLQSQDSALPIIPAIDSPLKKTVDNPFDSDFDFDSSFHTSRANFDGDETPTTAARGKKEEDEPQIPTCEVVASETETETVTALPPVSPLSSSNLSSVYRPPYVTDESELNEEEILHEGPTDKVDGGEMDGNDIVFLDAEGEQDLGSRHQDHPQSTEQQEEQQREMRRRQVENLWEDQRQGQQGRAQMKDRDMKWERVGQEEQRKEDLRQEQLRREALIREELRREQLRRVVPKEDLKEQLIHDGDTGINANVPPPPPSSDRPGNKAKAPRSAFIGNPDGSWQRVFTQSDGDKWQEPPTKDQSNKSGPKREKVEDIGDESSAREYPVHKRVDGIFWQPFYSPNSLDFVSHHLETRGYDPIHDRDQVILDGDIFVVPRRGDSLYVGFGQPQFGYRQDGAKVAVAGTPGNVVVQEQDALPFAPQGPNLFPRRSRPSEQQVWRVANDYTEKYMSAARTKSDPPRLAGPPRRKATEYDRRIYSIPIGHSLQEWNAREKPIMVLGSVFDAFSLGKWIYDWTAYHHGPATPIGDMAGDLWALMIQWFAILKDAEECIPRIGRVKRLEMVEDFLESAERLTETLKRLMRDCEGPMMEAWKQAKFKYDQESRLERMVGIAFIDTLFGRDGQLEATEKWMASVRLWTWRFDVNCGPILRKANPIMQSQRHERVYK